jgi:hypothetical protein
MVLLILDNLNIDVKKTSEMCKYIKNVKFSSVFGVSCLNFCTMCTLCFHKTLGFWVSINDEFFDRLRDYQLVFVVHVPSGLA